MALGAAEGHAHPDLSRRIDAVLDRGDAELLVVGAPLGVGHRVAVERGRHPLGPRRAGQEIAGDLLDRELVVGEVGVEGGDDPVAIAPDRRPERVRAVAGRIGVAGQVEPDPRPALAVAGVGEEPIDGPLVGVGRRISGHRLHLAGGRGKAPEVEADPAQEDLAVGLGRRPQPLAVEAVEDPEIDPAPRPRPVVNRRQRPVRRGDERPVLGVRGTFGDPALQQVDLRGTEPVAALPLRHPQRFVFLRDPRDQLAGLGLPRHDRHRAVGELGQGRLAAVEPQPLGAMRFVLPVAGEAVLRQNGPDLAVVIHRGDGRPRDGGAGNAPGPSRARAHTRAAAKSDIPCGAAKVSSVGLRRFVSLRRRPASGRADRRGAGGCGWCGGGASRPIPISGRAGNFGRFLWFSNLTDRRPQGETPNDIRDDSCPAQNWGFSTALGGV